MSRTVPAALLTHFGGELLTICVAVKVTRLDGTVLGFSDHDQEFTLAGVTYEPEAAIDATALRQQIGAGVDNMEILGALDSDRITDVDLLAGLYDGAEVEVFEVNWGSLADGTLPLVSGTVGEITFSEGTYTAEIRSLFQRLGQQIGELTSPTCRVKALGDARCKVNLASFQFSRTVDSVTSPTVLTFSGDSQAEGYYNEGRVIFTTGANAGLEREVKDHGSGAATGVAAEFDGTDVLQEPGGGSTGIYAGSDFTISGWVNFSTLTGEQVVCSIYDGLDSAKTPFVVKKDNGSDKLRFLCINTFGSNQELVTSTVTLVVGTWYHFACRHDGGTNISITVNGETPVNQAFTAGVPEPTDVPFTVGGIAGTASFRFSGGVAGLGFWRSANGGGGALSDAELTALYNGGVMLGYSGVQAVTSQDPKGWWLLSESSGTRADSTGTFPLSPAGSGVGSTTGPTGTGAQITLHESFPFTVTAGDVATLEAGCDRLLATCRDKFNNLVNARMEPHIPGLEEVLQRGRR